jgi:hypothetical protein
MAAEEKEIKPQEQESTGAGQSDEVDASKGIFPFGSPHPKDAEVVPAGSLGGGPYEESGRSGLDSTKKS